MFRLKCCVLNCESNDLEMTWNVISLHSFPDEPELAREWERLCGQPKPLKINRARICSFHFIDEDYEDQLAGKALRTRNRTLKKDSVPTLGLPNANEISIALPKQRRKQKENHVELLLNHAQTTEKKTENAPLINSVKLSQLRLFRKPVRQDQTTTCELNQPANASKDQESQPENLASQSTNLVTQSDDLTSQSTDLVTQSTNLISLTTNPTRQSTNLASQSTNIASQSKDSASQSTNFASQSTDIISQSKDSATHFTSNDASNNSGLSNFYLEVRNDLVNQSTKHLSKLKDSENLVNYFLNSSKDSSTASVKSFSNATSRNPELSNFYIEIGRQLNSLASTRTYQILESKCNNLTKENETELIKMSSSDKYLTESEKDFGWNPEQFFQTPSRSAPSTPKNSKQLHSPRFLQLSSSTNNSDVTSLLELPNSFEAVASSPQAVSSQPRAFASSETLNTSSQILSGILPTASGSFVTVGNSSLERSSHDSEIFGSSMELEVDVLKRKLSKKDKKIFKLKKKVRRLHEQLEIDNDSLKMFDNLRIQSVNVVPKWSVEEIAKAASIILHSKFCFNYFHKVLKNPMPKFDEVCSVVKDENLRPQIVTKITEIMREINSVESSDEEIIEFSEQEIDKRLDNIFL